MLHVNTIVLAIVCTVFIQSGALGLLCLHLCSLLWLCGSSVEGNTLTNWVAWAVVVTARVSCFCKEHVLLYNL